MERRNGQTINTKSNPGCLTYDDIENPEIRICMRTGELLMLAANQDPTFQRELDLRGLKASDFASDDDGLGLFPEIIMRGVEEVGGKGAGIRIVTRALDRVEDIGILNGDKEAVKNQLIFLQDKLRREYKQEKSTTKKIPSAS